MRRPLLLLAALLVGGKAWAIGEEKLIADHGFALSDAAILVDDADWPGVKRAAHDLEKDIEAVTGAKPSGKTTLLVGAIGHSPKLDALIAAGKLDVSDVKGKWEAYVIQTVGDQLVIAGSDKRGAIYGLYTLSEQIGVSPWYWWADVPVRHRDALYVAEGRHYFKPPAVKYRGIFLNDEAPSLTGWAKKRYGDLNHDFYQQVFELILRLRGNFLWPAMWGNAFNEDDPENPLLADEYGIVMSTSHHEPMMRAQQEWKRHGSGPWDYRKNPDTLNKFWAEGVRRNKNFESVTTIGMRGDGDKPMTDSEQNADIELLERIVGNQRQILAEEVNPDLAQIPQVWALYKEVQLYYEQGMRVPDDVTLLWCDDNWGNVRRLPTAEERRRPGGAGIYYHFDYVGGPRNYKWINTNPIAKVWEQMSLSYAYGADRLWVVNVGDLKPMEFPIEYFLTLARDPDAWPKERLDEFTKDWAARDFGAKYADEIADLVTRYGRLIGRRKPELLSPDTYSQTNYWEADRVVREWTLLRAQAEALDRSLPAALKDPFFELVLHPIKAASIVTELYVAAGKNHLDAKQGRARTNFYAARVRTLFQDDIDLTNQYNHQLAGGKWDHMMDQTHIGYTNWQQPPQNVMPEVTEVKLPEAASMGVEGEEAVLDFDRYNDPKRFIDIYNKGSAPFKFAAGANSPWIKLDKVAGEVIDEVRIRVSIDWSKLPGGGKGEITISGPNGQKLKLPVLAEAPVPQPENCFIEADGYVSIEAEHYSAKIDSNAASFQKIPDYGRTLSGMEPYPATAASQDPKNGAPRLEYRLYLANPGEVKVEAITGPSLNFVPGRGLRYAVSFDDETPQIVDIAADQSLEAWGKSVSDNVRVGVSKHHLSGSGYHTLKFWMVDPGVALEKLVVDLGGVKPSYLGPPESFRQ